MKYLLILAMFQSCIENSRENDLSKKDIECSLIKCFYTPMITKLDLNTYNLILLDTYEKTKDELGNKIKREKLHFNKSYDKQLNRWSLSIPDSLKIIYNYQFLFVAANDTVKFNLTDLKLDIKKVYADGQEVSICGLTEYKINSKLKKEGNIYFE